MPALLGPFVRCWFSVLWLAFFGFTRTGELESLPHAFIQLTRYECHKHTPTTNVFLKELVGVKLLFYASWFVYFIIFYFNFFFFVRRAAERHGARCWLAPRGCCFSVNYQRFNSSTTPSNLRDWKPDIYSLSRSSRENAPQKALVRQRTCVWVAVKTHALEVGQSTCPSAVKIKKRREGGERPRPLRLSHAVVNNSHWILFYYFLFFCECHYKNITSLIMARLNLGSCVCGVGGGHAVYSRSLPPSSDPSSLTAAG